MVQRGKCPNQEKVRNVQEAGGLVAIIADDVDESVDELVMEGNSAGSTTPLNIPGYMIEKRVALMIQEELQKGAVYLKSELEIKTESDKLTLGLFVSSSLDLSPEHMQTFAKLTSSELVTERSESSIDLHIHTFACPNCPDRIKEEDCVSDGRYCAYFPKRNDLFVEQMDSEDV